MKKTYKLDFQKIRSKTQVKDIISFEIYLKNVFSDLAKRDGNNKESKGIEKITFIDYMNLPFIVGEKIFNVINKNKNGYLSQNDFVTGIINLYVGGLEETQKIIFKMLDFDFDGIIIPEDSRLLISFIKNLADPPQRLLNNIKVKPRAVLSDEDNLKEINLIINNFFNNKPVMTFEEYKYNIENVNSDVFFLFICFLYNNKPFNNNSIKILKLLKNTILASSSRSNSVSCSSDDCATYSKQRIRSPSREFKTFVFDLVDIDLDEIQRDCEVNSDETDKAEDYLNNHFISEGIRNVNLPHLKPKINLFKLKGNKDYLMNHEKNKSIVSTLVIKNSYNNFVQRIRDLVIEEKPTIEFPKEELFNATPVSNYKNKRISKNMAEDPRKLSDKKKYLEEILDISNFPDIIYSKNQTINNKENSIKIFANENSTKSTSKINKSQTHNIHSKYQSVITANENVNKSKISDTPSKENLPKIEILNKDNSVSNYNSQNQTSIQLNQSSDFGHRTKGIFTNSNALLPGFDTISVTEEVNFTDIKYQNYIFRYNNNKLKKYYIALLGKDLFYFSNSQKKKLLRMNNLSGTYIYEDKDVVKVREEHGKNKRETSTIVYYPFKIYFKNKARVYYCPTEEEAKLWIKHIREASNYREIREHYEFGEDLGSGKFGKVKLGFNKQNKKKVAIKTIDKLKLKGIEFGMIKTEIEIMKFCKHKNIVRLIDNFEDIENIYIVLEYLSGGNLNFFLSNLQTLLSELIIKDLLKQMAGAIFYLHNFGIIHRDLKPENTMMSDLSDNNFIKIVDFGLSKILGINEKSKEAYGTLSYAAPEIILKKDYNNKVDIWSLGIIMYFLISGYLPFHNKNNNLSKIASDITKAPIKYDPIIWSRMSNDAKDLVMKCLERDKNKRLDIHKFLAHQWFEK
jgi:hypothetical protein